MSKIFIVIDVGCHECGVNSELVGVYNTHEKAQRAVNIRDKKYGGWRDGGQSIPEIFEFEQPTNPKEIE